jgi:hypothetical protein
VPGTEVLVQIALGLAVIGAAVLVLRWSWNSRKREGGTAERVDALEGLIEESDTRAKKVREKRAKSHGAWKKSRGRRPRA